MQQENKNIVEKVENWSITESTLKIIDNGIDIMTINDDIHYLTALINNLNIIDKMESKKGVEFIFQELEKRVINKLYIGGSTREFELECFYYSIEHNYLYNL